MPVPAFAFPAADAECGGPRPRVVQVMPPLAHIAVRRAHRGGRQAVKQTQYFHKQVYAQLSGPQLSVILDFEPLRQWEEECAAALRLLRGLRREYGRRFFDVVVVDSWYANGPFLKTVVEELGWPVIAVLKQERYEAHQEALALTRGEKPVQVVERAGRQVEIWDVAAVRFTDSYPGPVRVVRVRERWTERQRVWSTLKLELIYRGQFATRAEARRHLFEFIECFYHRQRAHSALDYLSPVDFETQNH